MNREELQDWMMLVHRRITRESAKVPGDTITLDFTPDEVKAILAALEIAGE